MSVSVSERQEKLIRAFQAFDTEKTGRVKSDAMGVLLGSIGQSKLTPSEVKEFISDADDGGYIDYRRFVLTVMFQ